MRQLDITKQKFNRLTALKFIGRKGNRYLWLFKCECGNKRECSKDAVLRGDIKSCGCLRTERIQKLNLKHGLQGSRFYRVWCEMKRRCNAPANKSFKNYGKKGIKVEWKSFLEFRDDMYKDYLAHQKSHKSTTIDRINPEGNYSKENCRWATYSEQQKNKREVAKRCVSSVGSLVLKS